MNENLPVALPEFPAKLNLFDVTALKPFLSTQEGKEALETFKKDKKYGPRVSFFIWVFLAVIVYLIYSNGHPFWAIFVALGGLIIVSSICSKIIANFNDTTWLSNKIIAHHQAVVEELVAKYFNNTAYFSYNTETLVYNNDLCVYLSTESGELIIYKKQNIKEVIRERVHLGSTTSSYATTTGTSSMTLASSLGTDPFKTRRYSSSTHYSTKTNERYEWHLDILTDFLPCPRISMVLPDEKAMEDAITKAYAVLKP